MGCYIAPENTLTIEDVVTAISRQTQGDDMLMAENFNADLAKPEGTTRAEEIAAALSAYGLEEISAHFLPRQKYWSMDGRTCSMRHGDRVVRSWTNYLLGMDHRIYHNVSVQDACHK